MDYFTTLFNVRRSVHRTMYIEQCTDRSGPGASALPTGPIGLRPESRLRRSRPAAQSLARNWAPGGQRGYTPTPSARGASPETPRTPDGMRRYPGCAEAAARPGSPSACGPTCGPAGRASRYRQLLPARPYFNQSVAFFVTVPGNQTAARRVLTRSTRCARGCGFRHPVHAAV